MLRERFVRSNGRDPSGSLLGAIAHATHTIAMSIDRCLIDAEARLPGTNDRLRAIGDLQLAEDIRDVVLHRLDAQC